MEKSRINFERAFYGVYCFDAKNLMEARELQKQGATKRSIKVYSRVISRYETDLEKRLRIEPRSYSYHIGPLIVVHENKYQVGLKQKAHIEELSAKIYLAKAMIDEQIGNSPENSLKDTIKHYQELGNYLVSLSRACSFLEDIAKCRFEGSAETSYNIARAIENKLESSK